MLVKFEQFLNYENIFKILGMDWKDPVCLLVLFVCYEYGDVKCGINKQHWQWNVVDFHCHTGPSQVKIKIVQ